VSLHSHKYSSVCGLDIGSNTFSFTELVGGSNEIEIINDLSSSVRLSEGLTDSGKLQPAAVMRGLMVLEKLKKKYDLGSKRLRVAGTAALRMASNCDQFTGPAQAILGVPVEVISGETEALITCRGALLGLPGDGPWIMTDIGGQSTEVCWQTTEGDWHPLSLELGVVGLTARYLKHDPPLKDELLALRNEVQAVFADKIPGNVAGQLIGVAGTATTLGYVELGLDSWQRDRVHGMWMNRGCVGNWLAKVAGITVVERTRQFGVRAGRADVFPAGICILQELISYFGKSEFVISANGLRVGLALSLLEDTDGTRIS
jgi:exopolyphosphatase / guanosine-5'-triphosphate,3'-diphosphate pyrophosphatase